jgi:Chaperone of endosialidase
MAILPVLACFAVLPGSQAVVPAPDGCYSNYTTVEGCNALTLNIGSGNTGVGFYSLFYNLGGNYNTAVGAEALVLNNADSNTVVGAAVLGTNAGAENTVIGTDTLTENRGVGNTATGYFALRDAFAGGNTANGHHALENNDDGDSNTAVGRVALRDHQTGSFNTAIGNQALEDNTSGVRNTAIGSTALSGVTIGSNNTGLGRGAGAFLDSGDGNVCIGAFVWGVAGENNTTRIRNVYETVQPVVGSNPDCVTIDSDARLGRANVSSRRYKHDIQPMDKASEVLYSLKPVSFRYNKQYDATQTLAFGLIAEEVAEVYPDLAGRNRQGEPESVRYQQINAMLLNEFLKEHRKVAEHETTIVELKKQIDTVVAQLQEQAAQIQKVSAQLEMRKSAAKVVVNKP